MHALIFYGDRDTLGTFVLYYIYVPMQVILVIHSAEMKIFR